MRESRPSGSVRAKAEWLSYSTLCEKLLCHPERGEGSHISSYL